MNKLLTKIAKVILGLSLAAGVGVAIGSKKAVAKADAAKPSVGTTSYSLLFSNIGSTGWSSSYANHTYTASDDVVISMNASKQSNTITTMPVTKGQPITLVLPSNPGVYISGFTFTASQWTSKTQTMTAHYSTNGGTSYTALSGTSSNFTITKSGLSEGTNAIKITFSSSSNQVGLQSFSVTYTALSKADVTLSLGSASNSMAVGATQQLSPTATSGGNTVSGLTYSYSSSKTSVATVSSSGLITAVSYGSTVISVSTAATNDYNAGSLNFNLSVTDAYVIVDLDFPVSGQTGTTTYSGNFTASNGGYSFTITNANNNNSEWDHIRIGRNATASTAQIYSGSAIAERITSLIIDFSAYNASGLTSATLYTANNSSFSNAYSQEFKSSITTSEPVVIEIPNANSAANLYYKLEFVCNANVASNGYIHIDQIIFRADPVSSVPSAVLTEDEVTLYTNNLSGVTAHVEVENCNDALYEWSTSSGKIILEDDDTDTVTIKPAANATAGDASVLLSVIGTGLDEELELTVHVVEPEPGETINNPFTVADALSHIDSVGSDGKTYYVTGIVSEIVTPYNAQYENISFNMSDDGLTTSNQLEAYRCGGTGVEHIEVGDVVIVSGTLTLYNSTTYEFNSGCVLESRVTPWAFDHLELATEEGYDNYYYQGSTFSPNGLIVLLWEHNSTTDEDRSTNVTASSTFNADLTTTGTKTLTATYEGHNSSNTLTYHVVEKPDYDIVFGSATGSTAINSTSVTANGWTITTTFSGEESFTQNAAYSQVGAAKKPAESISFTKTISSVVTIKNFFIDLGGFSDTAGTVTLKVGSTTVGGGSLNGTSDVTVKASSNCRGSGSSTVLTITISDIAKGVKVYGIGFEAKTDTEMVSEFVDEYMHMSHTTNDGSCISEGWYLEAKIAYGKLHDDQKSLFNSESQFADAKARLIAWAAANGEVFDPAAYTFTKNDARQILAAVIGTQNTNAITVIVIISLVSVTAIGGYFFIKRRQEN